MIAQSTLISYHTEAFVKTEVACTVLFKIMVPIMRLLLLLPLYVAYTSTPFVNVAINLAYLGKGL